ncbi:MBL fold metallo-hydrolase [Caballeronia sordidicola]|jgi:glyoxylase-like metal-dependent hydrolase (beta-lactamase superfamily II)|uniref:Beta-lactamase n=1 Tax=Caballeronia sordidicola TaxID=196367 RepID=A0A226WK24_CABSO|nr:MBL fold metallo-hydrolase [Caballeronia sordidicola]OXC71546.1 Beta-lactamase [Caballeronia sordidicola]
MITLPASMRVFERGWLSSNNVLFIDETRTALVDSGYASHAPQTLALVQRALASERNERTLDLIVNTHLHSDHCGGNALLQSNFVCETLIPQTEADAVREWDEDKLTFRATGQTCERFGFTGTIAPGATLQLGGLDWSLLGAPGHDPHSLMLYCAEERLLISADALWENGFGVIFPELEGESGFAEQRAVLDLIATLDVRAVIPGHGAPFTEVSKALDIAFSRIDYLRADPVRNAKNALKVLIVFKLMELRSMPLSELLSLVDNAGAMRAAANLLSDDRPGLVRKYLAELAASGVLRMEGETAKIS